MCEPWRGTNDLCGIQGQEYDSIQCRVCYHLAGVFRLQTCFCPIRQVRHIMSSCLYEWLDTCAILSSLSLKNCLCVLTWHLTRGVAPYLHVKSSFPRCRESRCVARLPRHSCQGQYNIRCLIPVFPSQCTSAPYECRALWQIKDCWFCFSCKYKVIPGRSARRPSDKWEKENGRCSYGVSSHVR